MKTKVLTLDNKASGDVELNDSIFGLEPRPDLIQRVVVWQLGTRAREASRQVQQLFRELLPAAEKARAQPRANTKSKSHVRAKEAVKA